MAKHSLVWIAGFSLVVAGCTTPAGNAATDTAVADTADSTASAETTATDTTATADAAVPVKRNPACGPFDASARGKKVPWNGYTIGQQTFTCNSCRGGDPLLQGQWRQIDFKTEDPATPMGDNKDVLTIDGNTWRQRIAGKDTAGKVQEQVIDGWYFCSDGAEFISKDQFWIMDNVVPDGIFGNKNGSFLRISALTSGSDLLALIVYDSFESKTTKTYNFCRVGSTIKGHLCNDPFAP